MRQNSNDIYFCSIYEHCCTTGTDPKPTWESCLECARQTRAYVDACLVTLSNPAATLPADKKAAKDEYEWRTPLHQLKALREVLDVKNCNTED